MRFLKFILFSLLVLVAVPCLFAEQGMPAVEQASQENKHLFIFFYKDQNDRTLRSQELFDQVMQKVGDRANFVKVKINDPSEKQIIDKFNLKRSPMPFVLVLAPNGAVTGGFPSNFTEQQLLDSFASPGMATCLKGLQDRRLVFLCLQNRHTTNNEAAMRGVREFQADPRFSSATEVVVIDPSDMQERKFLNQLAIDIHSPQAITVFISPPAQTIGQYKGSTSKEQFISDLQKAVSGCCGTGGCCPGGCCPGGKCK
jgi:hypothetical protein